MLGWLRAERVCPAHVAMAAVATTVRGKHAVSSDDLYLPRCEAWMPAVVMVSGKFPSQLTAGGEELLNNMSCNERLRSSCEPSTKTHTASGWLNKI